MGGSAAVLQTPLTHIPHPPSDPGITLQTLGQAAQQQVNLNTPGNEQLSGDAVCKFGEAAAAAGFLGRFPGSAIMPLVRQFIGMNLN